jgi:hypothetical protein
MSSVIGGDPPDFSNLNTVYKAFHGTKLAQRGAACIEIIGVLTQLAHPHNLKVIGSNPIPATKLRRQVKDLAAF